MKTGVMVHVAVVTLNVSEAVKVRLSGVDSEIWPRTLMKPLALALTRIVSGTGKPSLEADVMVIGRLSSCLKT